MTTVAETASAPLGEPADGAPAKPVRMVGRTGVISRLTARRAARSGAVLGMVIAVYSAIQAFGYVDAYKTEASRRALAATLTSSSGLTALVGPGHDLASVAGYTAWKCFMVLALVAAVWGLLTGTKLLRGEEEAGRWEVLLAGGTNRRRATSSALGGLAAAAGVLFAVASVLTALVWHSHSVGISPAASVFFVFAVACSAAVFLAIGALAGELAATRRQAAAYAGAVLGVSFALRMVADTNASLAWLRWLSPLGWVEQLRPLAAPDPWPLLLIAAFVLACGGLSIQLAGRRDLGSSTLSDRSSAPARTGLLSGPLGLGVRLVRPTALAWMAGIAALALIIASETNAATKSLDDSSSAREVLSRLGGGGVAQGAYLGASFFILAVVVAIAAIGHVTAARSEEGSGRIDHLVARPLSRARWLSSRLLVAVCCVVTTALVGGLCMWLGVAGQHTTVTLGSLLGAGLNTVPPALCLLGLGTLVFGLWPRFTSYAVYGLLVWAFLLELIGGILGSAGWVLDTSPFHQMAPAPAVAPDWMSGAVMVAVGLASAALGVTALAWRDLMGD